MNDGISVSFTACIPAGGVGRRMNASAPKQYLEIAGKPILIHTLSLFDSIERCRRIVVSAVDMEETIQMLEKHPFNTEIAIVPGGATRQQSVLRALNACDEEDDIVLIHDAVRPCISEDHVLMVCDAVMEHGAAMLALQARDTIKRVEDGYVSATLDRGGIWLAQTPQGAPLHVLKQAFEDAVAAGFSGTDDASLLERIGVRVAVVEGSPENIKITSPEDIAVAEMILNRRRAAL